MKKENINKIFFGLLIGLICGMFTAGGGLILVPVLINIFKLEEKTARGTAIFCILPLVITAAIMYTNNNNFDINLAIKCALGGVIGAIIGGTILNKAKIKNLQIAFIIFLYYAGINILFKWGDN